MCKIFGYMRVSTTERAAKQDYERQRYLLDNSGIQFDEIFEEHISGGIKGNQREQFNKMLELLQPTDIVCFTETSRFGRNYIDCFDMLDIITQEKQATVRFLSNGIELKGGERLNPYEWLTISNFFIMDGIVKSNMYQKEAESYIGKKVNIYIDGEGNSIIVGDKTSMGLSVVGAIVLTVLCIGSLVFNIWFMFFQGKKPKKEEVNKTKK